MLDRVFDWNTVEPRTIIPGFEGRFIHTDSMTFVLWTIAAGAVLPEHNHVHEQVAYMLAGDFELVVEGEAIRMKPGMVVDVPSYARHSARALADCTILDVFSPVREDYRSAAGPTILGTAASTAR